MPPRKKRGIDKVGSSSTNTFDHTRFKTRAHEERFKNVFLTRSLVRERGFSLQEGEYPEIQDQIKERNWIALCAGLPAGKMNLVREFYANAYVVPNDEQEQSEEIEFKSFVRGKEIDFSPRTIDAFFGIGYHYPDYCSYDHRMEHEQRLTDVLRDLCKEGATWEMDAHGRPLCLKKADLISIPRAWCTFVQSRLITKLNHSEVRVEQAVLIHCIMRGTKIDVGSLIASKIHEMAQASSGSLGYPSLITQLCRRAGVDIEGDIPVLPERPITAASIAQETRRPRTQQRGQEQPSSSTQPSSSRPRRPLTTAQRLEQLENFQRLSIRQNQFIIQAVQGLDVMVRRMAVEQGMGPDELDEPLVPDEDLLRPIYFEPEQEAREEEENADED